MHRSKRAIGIDSAVILLDLVSQKACVRDGAYQQKMDLTTEENKSPEW